MLKHLICLKRQKTMFPCRAYQPIKGKSLAPVVRKPISANPRLNQPNPLD